MINNIEKEYVWLDCFMLPLKKRYKLIEFAGGILKVRETVLKFKSGLEKILTDETIELMQKNASDSFLDKKIKELEKFGIEVISIESEAYPELLKEISEPPLVLYTRGDASILNKKCLAVVGTRSATSYGREVATSFCKKLIKAGLVLVSGLAYGIDTCVANSSVSLTSPTIAVLGGGLDNIYPAQNTNLANLIVNNGGCLVSEYPIGVKPTKGSFLERNRIVSGLSLGVLVVEAGDKSGAQSTANDAVSEGRELFVVPGNITSRMSAGCNKLLLALPTAICLSAEQVLKTLNIEPAEEKMRKNKQYSIEENLILKALSEEKSFDELAEITKIDSKSLLSTLSSLEINGIIKNTTGNYYAKITWQN